MKFKDKAVLITGATRGIGFATARLFLEQGARIAVNGRTAESVKAAMEKLDKPGRIVPSPGDIGVVADCESVVQNAIDKLGGLNVLVNAAGVCRSASIEGSDEALWDYTLEINLKRTFFLLQDSDTGITQNQWCHYQPCIGCRTAGREKSGRLLCFKRRRCQSDPCHGARTGT